MPRGQRGGFLEPVQKTPAFKYTANLGRQAWTQSLYPYAPYFFNIVREIPWDEFKYEDDQVIARCNRDTPYVLMGGSAIEALDKEYGKSMPPQHRLHKHVDPTGDIDIYMAGPVLTKKDGSAIDPAFFEDAVGTWKPWANAFTMWILDHVEAYFKKLAYNFDAWFPENVDFEPSENFEGKFADTPIRKVGPFSIYRLVQPSDDPTDIAHTKIQVSTALPFINNMGDEQYYNDHFMEFLFWEPATEDDMKLSCIELPKLGLRTRGFLEEMIGNLDGTQNRLQWLDSPMYRHKIINHIGRGIFMMNLMAVGVTTNLPTYTEEVEELYATSILTVSTHPYGADYAKEMMVGCPPQFRGSDPSTYAIFKDACSQIHETLDACGLRKSVPGASSPRPGASLGPTPSALAKSMAAYTGVSVGGKRKQTRRRRRKTRRNR